MALAGGYPALLTKLLTIVRYCYELITAAINNIRVLDEC